MRATETEGNGGSNKEHEVERKKESRMSSSVCTYILMYSFVCVHPSVVCSFVNACAIIIMIIREEEEGSQGIHAGDRNRGKRWKQQRA